MSEYLVGPQEDSAGNAGPAGQTRRRTSHVDESRPVDGDREHVRFGIPFNGVIFQANLERNARTTDSQP